MLDLSLFDHLAVILSYPTPQLLRHVEAVCEDDRLSTESVQDIRTFADYARRTTSTEVEEHYTHSFDLNPSCCLEIGWHLYGEEYERGAFLVNMRQTLREEQIPETGELPDHLSYCLRLLPRLKPDEAVRFARGFLQPALGKILGAMTAENPYTGVLLVTAELLKQRYGAVEEEVTERKNILELPVLNNRLHYHNTEDADGRF